MYCSDLSPAGIEYRAELVKVRRWHSAAGVDFESVQPRFLSPEMRQVYADWALGKEAEVQTDLVAAAVFSAAVLILSLLNPAKTQKVLSCQALAEVLSDTVLPEGLRKILERMLDSSVESRVTVHTALTLVELLAKRSELSIVSILNQLVREDHLAEALIALTIADSLNLYAKVTYFCSDCGNPITTSEPSAVSRCPKHIFCSPQCHSSSCTKACKADTSHCPLCEVKPVLRRLRVQPKSKNATRVCEACQREFEANSMETWRMDLVGSSLFNKAQTVCSQACLGLQAEPAIAPRPVVPQPVDRYDQAIATLSKMIPIFNARSRVLEDTYSQLDAESQQDLLASQELHSLETFVRAFCRDNRCHTCHKELRSLISTRMILCSKVLKIVCGVDCLRRVPGSSCPCGGQIEGSSIISALGGGDPLCQNCGAEVGERPVCGHSFCRRCMLEMESCVMCMRGEHEIIRLLQQILSSSFGK